MLLKNLALGASDESSPKNSGGNERSTEHLGETHIKEDLSIYKPWIKSFRALTQIQNEFGFPKSV